MSGGHSREVGKEKRWIWEGTIGPTVEPPLEGYFAGSFQGINLKTFTCKISISPSLCMLLNFKKFRHFIEIIAEINGCKLTDASIYKHKAWVFIIDKPNRMFLEEFEQLLRGKKFKDTAGLKIELQEKKTKKASHR